MRELRSRAFLVTAGASGIVIVPGVVSALTIRLAERLPKLVERQRRHQQPDNDKIVPGCRQTDIQHPWACYEPRSDYDADPFLPRSIKIQRHPLDKNNHNPGNYRGACRCWVQIELQNPGRDA